MIREAIQRLVDGHDLDVSTAAGAMDEIMSGEATTGQISGFLVALRMKGETVDEIVGLVRSMSDHATPITAPAGAVDTCGTGGDGSGSFNISTAAALVVSGAGVVVAKHGNRGQSSQCGSADVLEALGVPIGLEAGAVERCIREVGFGFLYAPTFHPAMRHASAARKELGLRTVFNVLGPLANPARVKRQALGVATARSAESMVQVLAALGHQRALVFHGDGGLDELSTSGKSHLFDLRDGKITEATVDPSALGLAPPAPGDLKGGDAQLNAGIVREVLDGAPGPRRDVVLLNAAAGLVAGGRCDDLGEGLKLSAQAIDSGAARDALARIVEVAGRLAGGRPG